MYMKTHHIDHVLKILHWLAVTDRVMYVVAFNGLAPISTTEQLYHYIDVYQ